MAGPIRIAILANGQQARSEMTRTGASMGRLGRLAGLGVAAAGVGILALGKSAITAEAKFSTSMRLIQAATKAPRSEMGKLNDLAIKLGADTSFSASEAADAMLELAKAGIDTKTIMGGGLSGTLTLAAAGGTDLGTAATIASNALNTFNLQGKDMATVAAALAGGANASSASVESLGQALQQVGPGATNAGLSLQETVAALSAFDASGIKGSDAGTSLKTMLARLVPQTDKAANAMDRLNLDFTKSNGEFVSLANMSEQLKRGLGKLSAEQRTSALTTIFGSDATRAATVLMNEGEGGIRKFITATNDQGAAQKMAKARMGGTAGALERLSGSVETAQLRLGQELAPATEAVADFLAKQLVPAMDATIDAAKDVGKALAPVGDALQALGGLSADAAGQIGGLPDPLKGIGIQAGIAALALPKLKGALGSVGTSVSGYVTGIRDAETRTRTLGSTAKNVAGVGGLLLLTSSLSDAKDDGASFGDVMKGAAGGAGIGAMFGPIGALVGAGVGGGLTALTGAFAETSEEAKAARLELLKTQGFENAKEDAESLRTALQGVINAYGRTARAAVEASFTGDDGKLDSDVARLRSLGVSMDTITSASMGNAVAQMHVNAALAKGGKLAETNRDKYRVMWEDAQDGMTQWTDYYGNVHVKQLSSDRIEELGRKYRYWDEQVKAGKIDAETFGRRIEENTGVISDHSAQMRQLARDLNIPIQRYKQFPQAIRTRFESKGLPQTAADALRLLREYKSLQSFKRIRAVVSAPGVDLTRRQVRELGKQYKLTPKQVRTLLRVEGAGKAQGSARDTRRELENVGEARANVNRWIQDVFGGTQDGRRKAEQGSRTVKEALEHGASAARANLGPFNSSLTSGMSTARSNASSGGRGIGSALGSGINSGIDGWVSTISTTAARAVNEAESAARGAADARSPSRKMMALGHDMAEGLVVGMTLRERNAAEAGRRLAAAALVGSTGRRFSSAAVSGASAGPLGSVSGRAAPGLAEGQRLTLVADGYPISVIARREIAADRRHNRGLEDRD